MSLEKRKVFIEMLGPKTCRITTLYRQKVFEFNEHTEIDLISFKSGPSMRGVSFLAKATQIDDERSFYFVEVWARIEPHGMLESWGSIDIYGEKEKLFQGTIWTK